MVSLSVSGPERHGAYRIARTLSVLDAIEEQDVSVAVYRRPVPNAASTAFNRWAHEQAPSYDEVVVPGAWDATRAIAGVAQPAMDWLRSDVSQLLTRFSSLSGASRVRVLLRAVRTDACRKFHVDFVHLRLITTYLGPGTEWLPRYAVRRDALDHPPDCPCDANRAIVRDRRSVRSALTGDVLLMKGERYGCGAGAVHRSPPIETAGITRLVLTLTAASSS